MEKPYDDTSQWLEKIIKFIQLMHMHEAMKNVENQITYIMFKEIEIISNDCNYHRLLVRLQPFIYIYNESYNYLKIIQWTNVTKRYGV